MSTTNNVKARLRIARKTEAEWTSTDPVGLDGEWMVTTDASVLKLKIGDGTSKWSELDYVEFGEGGDYLPLSGGTLTGALEINSRGGHSNGYYTEISDFKILTNAGNLPGGLQDVGIEFSPADSTVSLIYNTSSNKADSFDPPRLTGVGTPTSSLDAANKQYVDSAVKNVLKVKNVTLNLSDYTFASSSLGHYYCSIAFGKLLGSYSTVYSASIINWNGLGGVPTYLLMDSNGTSLNVVRGNTSSTATGTLIVRILYT